jgi:hypothetical protein
MSKPISSFPKSKRHEVAVRRSTSGTGGLGQLSAVDFLKKEKEGKLEEVK